MATRSCSVSSSYQLHKAASPQSDSFWNEVRAQELCADEDCIYSAGVYDEEEDIYAERGMSCNEMAQMLTLGLEDKPVATSSVLQMDELNSLIDLPSCTSVNGA
jgi:hypothetical protein